MATLEEQLAKFSISDDLLLHFREESFLYKDHHLKEDLEKLHLQELRYYLTRPNYPGATSRFINYSLLGAGVGLSMSLFSGSALWMENLIRYGELKQFPDFFYASLGLTTGLSLLGGLTGATKKTFKKVIIYSFLEYLRAQKEKFNFAEAQGIVFGENSSEIAQFFDEKGKLKINY